MLIVVVMFTIAIVVDYTLTDEQVRTWRASTKKLRDDVVKINNHTAVIMSHGMFCGLFDAIYGKEYWSKKRLIRSCYSTILAIIIVTLILEWDSTLFGRIKLDDYVILFGTFVGVFVLNAGADFLSLQETRWIMDRSKGKSLGMLGAMMIVDVVATAAIWVIGFIVIGWPFSQLVEREFDFRAIYMEEKGLVLFLSTFFTSCLWLAYLVSVACIRTIKRHSRVVGILIDVIGENDAPAKTVAGIAAILLVTLYGLSSTIVWMVRSVAAA